VRYIDIYMISIKKLSIISLVAVMALGVTAAPALGQPDNIICSGTDSTTDLGGILSNVTNLLVVLAALVAIGGGAVFALASAARPGEEEYVEKRNKAVLYGGSVLLVMYGGDAIITALIGEQQSIGCILPGTA
jgi:hypothetical protein